MQNKGLLLQVLKKDGFLRIIKRHLEMFKERFMSQNPEIPGVNIVREINIPDKPFPFNQYRHFMEICLHLLSRNPEMINLAFGYIVSEKLCNPCRKKRIECAGINNALEDQIFLGRETEFNVYDRPVYALDLNVGKPFKHYRKQRFCLRWEFW